MPVVTQTVYSKVKYVINTKQLTSAKTHQQPQGEDIKL